MKVKVPCMTKMSWLMAAQGKVSQKSFGLLSLFR